MSDLLRKFAIASQMDHPAASTRFLAGMPVSSGGYLPPERTRHIKPTMLRRSTLQSARDIGGSGAAVGLAISTNASKMVDKLSSDSNPFMRGFLDELYS